MSSTILDYNITDIEVIIPSWHNADIEETVSEFKNMLNLTNHKCILNIHILDLVENDENSNRRKRIMNLLLSNQIIHLPCCLTYSSNKVYKANYINQDLYQTLLLKRRTIYGNNDEDTITKMTQIAISYYQDFKLYEAATTYFEILQIDKEHKTSLFNLACLLHMAELPTLAIYYLEKYVLLDGEDMTAQSFLWALANSEAARGAGINAYERLAKTNIVARHKLAVLTGQGEAALRGDPLYAKQVFDDISAQFEDKLVTKLGYRGPWILEEILNQYFLSISTEAVCNLRMLDIGMGSGLCGSIFSKYVKNASSSDSNRIKNIETNDNNYCMSQLYQTPNNTKHINNKQDNFDNKSQKSSSCGIMVGVDISKKMCDIASRAGFYDIIICDDFQEVLNMFICQNSRQEEDNVTINNQHPMSSHSLTSFDIIISADVFIYVGVLGNVMSSARHALKKSPWKLMLFSVEDLDNSPLKVTHENTHSNDDPNKIRIEHGTKYYEHNTSEESLMISPIDELVENNAMLPYEVVDNEIVGAMPGWGGQLLSSARYAHSHAYIEALAIIYHYKIISRKNVNCLRNETGVPLPGIFYLIQFH